ncbi:hypothetical protein [Metabacillus sp. 22489]|uniref:hypothetical protein n=1 Tax=Metabacillus sp. 22489 TaxID=3453928 RepID=UPI003F87860A
MNKIKVITVADNLSYFLDGLLLNDDFAIYYSTQSFGKTFFYAKVRFNESLDAYEVEMSGNLADNTQVLDPMQTLQDIKKMLNEVSLFTFLTKFEFWTDEPLGLIHEGGTKVKEWKNED